MLCIKDYFAQAHKRHLKLYDLQSDNDDGVYGVLYTWAAALGDNTVGSDLTPSGIQGICPNGFHIPSQDEWVILTDYLGDAALRGGKLKEAGTSHWQSPNTNATNETGFGALPTGRRNWSMSSPFVGRETEGYWWSTSDWGAGND